MTDTSISRILNSLNQNQKMSVLNLLTSIAFADDDGPNPDREIQELNFYVETLNLHQGKCLAYFDVSGYEGIIGDLKTLPENVKLLLVSCAWDLIICDDSPNEKELERTIHLFDAIGVPEDVFLKTLQKAYAITGKFS